MYLTLELPPPHSSGPDDSQHWRVLRLLSLPSTLHSYQCVRVCRVKYYLESGKVPQFKTPMQVFSCCRAERRHLGDSWASSYLTTHSHGAVTIALSCGRVHSLARQQHASRCPVAQQQSLAAVTRGGSHAARGWCARGAAGG